MTNNNEPRTLDKLLSELQEIIDRDRQFLAHGEAILTRWRDQLSGQRESEAAGVSTPKTA
jgi:hypothetical protein